MLRITEEDYNRVLGLPVGRWEVFEDEDGRVWRAQRTRVGVRLTEVAKRAIL